jgi:uridine kinase
MTHFLFEFDGRWIFTLCGKIETKSKMIYLLTGASASGKSTLAMHFAKLRGCIIIPQDAFCKKPFQLFPHDGDNADGSLEKPDAYDWWRLVETVKLVHEFSNVVVEGHCLLTCEKLVELADHVFFIDIDRGNCKSRYVRRYADNSSTSQLEDKEKYFDMFTWPIHCEYVATHVVGNPDVVKISCLLKNAIEDINNIL